MFKNGILSEGMISKDNYPRNIGALAARLLGNLADGAVVVQPAQTGDVLWPNIRIMAQNGGVGVGRVGNHHALHCRLSQVQSSSLLYKYFFVHL